ncbi:MAG: EpsG family protein [Muribaculaceae bacterium]|nr:EpsG family protein [Muribaculaceae bacterium]
MWQYFAIITAIAAGIIFHDLRHNSLHIALSPTSGTGISTPDVEGNPASRHSFIRINTRRDAWLLYFWIVIGALCLLAGLRYSVGIDTIISMGRYDYLPALKDMTADSLGRSQGGRHAWILIMLKSLGIGLWSWQMLCALILNLSFAIVLRKYTRLWFVGIACWCLFGYIILDFETMLAGAAAGCLIAGIPDLERRRFGRFYIKLLIGAVFHLSALAMAWLPIMCSTGLRRFFGCSRNLLVCLLLAPAVAFGLKWLILVSLPLLDAFPAIGRYGFQSEYILKYGETILEGASLNLKGYIGLGFCNILIPLGAALLLLRAKDGQRSKSLFGMILISYSILELMRFEVIAFGRLSMLLLPALAIGLAMSLEECRSRALTFGWWGAVVLAGLIGNKSLFDPMPLTGEGRRLEMYYPYCSWLDKGIVYRRAWLAFDYMIMYDSLDPNQRKPVYDFTFELKPGEREIHSPFYPRQTHADMELLRRRICRSDSVAPVIPCGTVKQQ